MIIFIISYGKQTLETNTQKQREAYFFKLPFLNIQKYKDLIFHKF